MKRILNLNNFSGPALAVIAAVGLLIPLALLGASALLGGVLALRIAARIFMLTGGGLLGLFLLLVVIEQVQDHLLYQKYLRERGKIVQGECPYCGNRQLRSFEKDCPVCGKRVG